MMIQKIANLVLFGFMILMNYLANALPINNKTTGQLSDQLPNLFTPAGITFSIWGIIYLLLGIFAFLQFRQQNRAIVDLIGWWFVLSCLLNAAWIIAWHYENLPVSLLIMLGLLGSLIIINMALRFAPLGLVKAAFGVYLGWICIATIANVTALLVKFNWQGAGISHETWTLIMIAIGTAIAIAAIFRLDNPFVGLSVIWAFSGIVMKRLQDSQSIVIAAVTGAILVLILVVISFYRHQPLAQT